MEEKRAGVARSHPPDFLENLHGEISGSCGSEKRSALIAAEGDEVKIAVSGDALEIFGHRREEGPTLCLPQAGKG